MNLVRAAIAAALLVPSALAHDFRQGYIFLKIHDGRVEGRVELNLGDLNRALGLAFRTDGTVTVEELTAEIEAISAYVFGNVAMSVDGREIVLEPTGHGLFATDFAQFASLSFVLAGVAEPPQLLDVTYELMFEVDPEHRGFLVIEHYWEAGLFDNEAVVSLTFEPGHTRKRLDLTAFSAWTGILELTKLGVHHIWIGIDHILFLMVLLAPAVLRRNGRRWEPVLEFRSALWGIVKIVTVFTIAHSITLSLAALDVVQLPGRLVESVIALSIAVAAVDILVPVFRDRILWVVAGFGLFHGFGFANVLGEMGISGANMALSLLGFNVGVEIGQLVIGCLVFPLLFMMRLSQLYTRFFIQFNACLAIAIALYWLVERAFDVELPVGRYLEPVFRLLP